MLLAACGEQGHAPPAAVARAEPIGEGRTTAITAMRVQARDLSRELNLSASVQPQARVRLASRTSGTVERVYFETGQRVRRGQRLAQLDMSEQQAELARARAEEGGAELAYRRAAELRERGMVSQAAYETARVAHQVARSERALWETRVGFGRVVAPLDGVITARHVEPGEAVQAQGTLFEISAMDSLVLRPGVSELDVVHLQPGQTETVRFDALPGLELPAQVRRILPVAEGAGRLVPVEFALPPNAYEQGVRPGFLARVQLRIDQRADIMAVPSLALGEDDGGHYVYVVHDGRLQQRRLTPGVQRGAMTEILDGLSAGDAVLSTSPAEFRDGQPVRVVDWR